MKYLYFWLSSKDVYIMSEKGERKMNKIFDILKTVVLFCLKCISWFWIFICTFMIAVYISTNEASSIFVPIVFSIPTIVFLIWRYIEEKDIREEKKKIKIEKIQMEKELLREKEFKELADNENKISIKTLSLKKKKIISLLMIFAVIIIGFTYPTQKVKSMAKKEILRNLKAPSTAEFSNFNIMKNSYNGNKYYIVEVDVDSENGFGAKLRNRFEVSISKDLLSGYYVEDVKSIDN